ncbi:flagellar filament capping protein FliD [Desulfosediminicola flagellatus]|uniref:flagellar filament capping protein FliD n=1 Tax=Desulfosediminicola flagellatus TaxID=2569541 RepID=UPI0010AD6C65|nr:flagellar filament capping protein FliD [Desulfosediminicola flagellatus]
MAITFSGLATGLDTDSIVSQIMAVERAPIDRLTAQKEYQTERLNAFFQFKGKLDDLKTAASDMSLTSQVRTTKASLSSEGPFTASTESAAIGSYEVSIAQLAQTQKTVSDGFSSSSDSILGTGTITVNGVDISITEDNDSLLTLAESINKISDQTGVSVSIINDGSDTDPYHMVFTGKDANTSFTVTSDLVDGAGDPVAFNTTEGRAAQQAVAFIDGIKVVSDSNTISNAISGVTINLDALSQTSSAGTEEIGVDPWDWADPPVYATTQLEISADSDALKEKVTSFVNSYNAVIEFINSGYEEFGGGSAIETESSDEDADSDKLLGSILRGDSSVNNVKRQLQSVLTQSINNEGAFSILSEIGISTQRDGSLKQDNSKLDAAISNNFDDMVALLSGEGEVDGVMKKFNSLLLNVTSVSSGVYATQKNSFLSSSKDIDSQIEVMESRMTKRESTLRSQFSAMEALVSGLNAQSAFLTQQLSALNNKE